MPTESKCCQTKTVGETGYILVEEGEVPSQCKDGCIYQKEDMSAVRYCFAPGDLPVTCGGITIKTFIF